MQILIIIYLYQDMKEKAFEQRCDEFEFWHWYSGHTVTNPCSIMAFIATFLSIILWDKWLEQLNQIKIDQQLMIVDCHFFKAKME